MLILTCELISVTQNLQNLMSYIVDLVESGKTQAKLDY